jgi:putative hydrolase of HD superfamily
MENIANFLFEARALKDTPRSGYQFLGNGSESVAEHTYMITVIAWVMAQMDPATDPLKIITMALFHDLPEARTGDLNYVNQKYNTTHEEKATEDLSENIFFGGAIKKSINEFNAAESREAQLAKDADQLSFMLELKKLLDTGSKGPEKWLPIVEKRIQTDIGKKIAMSITDSTWDNWWLDNYQE